MLLFFSIRYFDGVGRKKTKICRADTFPAQANARNGKELLVHAGHRLCWVGMGGLGVGEGVHGFDKFACSFHSNVSLR